jgi:hypothetical protein
MNKFLGDKVELRHVSQNGGLRDTPKVQEWLGHANIATTRLYDRWQSRWRRVRRLRWSINGLKRENLRTYGYGEAELSERVRHLQLIKKGP